MNTLILDRLASLRNAMSKRGIEAFIIPGTDPHQSEYCAEHWKCREWISGFNGSAGTAVVTQQKAVLSTDSRYFLQVTAQLEGTSFELLKQGLPTTPSINEWLLETIPPASTIAIDGTLFSTAEALSLKKRFEDIGYSFVSDFDPFVEIWNNRPTLPLTPVFIHDEQYSGATATSKITEVNNQLAKKGANATLLTALDEIAWTLNLRGSDVECNPVAIAYAYISSTDNVLFIHPDKITPEVATYLSAQGVKIMNYSDINTFLRKLPANTQLLIDVQKVNFTLYNILPVHCLRIPSSSPVALLKSVKNETQAAGFRQAMIKDGIALVHFSLWLQQNVTSGRVKETAIGEKLIDFRKEQPLFVGESFATIAGFNAHGAIIHYHATPDQALTITPEGFLLIDSGGQYLDGTTDITRTLVMGELSPEQKRDYTLVLKGHIGIATCCFPQGTRGAQLDILARKNLWEYGLNYLHGTGHGIGHFLNVHEGPQNIRLEENPTPLLPGMVLSNEPGIYHAGKYGIRLENLIRVIKDKSTEFGDFYKFETLTLFPFDRNAIDTSLLCNRELTWLNSYHQQVFDKLSPHLNKEEKEWLKNATAPLDK